MLAQQMKRSWSVRTHLSADSLSRQTEHSHIAKIKTSHLYKAWDADPEIVVGDHFHAFCAFHESHDQEAGNEVDKEHAEKPEKWAKNKDLNLALLWETNLSLVRTGQLISEPVLHVLVFS